MAINDLETELDQLQAEFYQSTMNKDIEPFLDQIEMILPDQPIKPIMQFRLLVKASGSDLPSDGSWFQISVAGQELSNAKIISQPQGETIGFGMTGEWHVELPAPMETGDYWLLAAMDSVETEKHVVKMPFTVEQVFDPEPDSYPSLNKQLFFSIAFLGSVFGIIWLGFSTEIKTTYESWSKNTSPEFSDIAYISKKDEELAKKQVLDSKTKVFIDEMLEQSFNDLSVSKRQKAWRKLSQFIDKQTDADNPHVLEIQKKRSSHKQHMERWLASNENPEESLKRLLVLAFVDDDETAQRRLGGYYSSGKGVVKDLGEAWRWYQRAANKGDAESQQLLEALEAYADQLLKSSDLNERLQGYAVAEAVAFAGGINAQLWMGYRYETGDGVNRNLLVATDWYRKAAEQGNILASKKLEEISDLIGGQ